MAKELEIEVNTESVSDMIRSIQASPKIASVDGVSDAQFAVHVEEVITQVLENNVATLDALRKSAEMANIRDYPEIRLHGNDATHLLSGCDGSIDYYLLAAVIQAMKAGIARRRVALES